MKDEKKSIFTKKNTKKKDEVQQRDVVKMNSYRENHQNHGDGTETSEMSPETQEFSATVLFKNHGIMFKKFHLKKPSSNHRLCLPPPIWPYGSHISSEVATACYAWLHNFASLWLNDPSWLWPPTKGSKALQKFQTQGSRSWF